MQDLPNITLHAHQEHTQIKRTYSVAIPQLLLLLIRLLIPPTPTNTTLQWPIIHPNSINTRHRSAHECERRVHWGGGVCSKNSSSKKRKSTMLLLLMALLSPHEKRGRNSKRYSATEESNYGTPRFSLSMLLSNLLSQLFECCRDSDSLFRLFGTRLVM